MKNDIVVLLTVCYLAGFVTANPKKVHVEDGIDLMESKLTKAMDELNKKGSIGIYGDMITLEKVDVTEAVQEDNINAEKDPLIARVDQFLKSRKLQINLPNDGSPADFLGRALGGKNIGFELRGLTSGASEARTKLKKIIIPILLALKLKALIVLPIIVTIIGLIGIKGLGAGLAALLLSGAVALKALLTPPPTVPARVSYGIVKPHEIHHDHWHRSQEEINQPYRGWAPEYNADQYPYDLP